MQPHVGLPFFHCCAALPWAWGGVGQKSTQQAAHEEAVLASSLKPLKEGRIELGSLRLLLTHTLWLRPLLFPVSLWSVSRGPAQWIDPSFAALGTGSFPFVPPGSPAQGEVEIPPLHGMKPSGTMKLNY